eukprot:EG_transcript_11576
MCEYWKSVPMWRCPYCKCNIQDTKAARQFHENGRRHKEAVEKHMLLTGIKGLQRQKAQTDVERELKIIEAAALSSYMTHDLNGVLESVPETEIKVLPQVGKPLSERYQTVSSTTSANPEYGTPEYTQWYFAWRQYYMSQGEEKAMLHIPAPPEGTAPHQRQPNGQPPGQHGGSKGSKGGPPRPKGQSQPRRSPHSPRPDDPASPTAVPRQPTSPVPAPPPQRFEEDDDELESCDVGDDSFGPQFSAWSTVAVRPLRPPSSSSPNENESAGEEEAEEEPEDELSDSCEEENGGRDGYRGLSFNFSRQPQARPNGAQTGFRVATYTKEEVTAVAQPVASVKLEPLETDAAALARQLVPLSEQRGKLGRIIKPEATGMKGEREDEGVAPAGLKRSAPVQFACRGKRQYRRRGDDDEGD